ncbi:MAG: hypothetical protein AAGI28_05455 [Pseudomonadota bacterium]
MQMTSRRAFDEAIFVRLFRLWAMGYEDRISPLPTMHAEAISHGYKDQTAMACASLFELVQGHLGRTLVRECCCSTNFSSDERALIGILQSAPSLSPGQGSREVPHGLPGAICWAAASVCDAMGMENKAEAAALKGKAANSQGCPFSTEDNKRQITEVHYPNVVEMR